MTDWIEVVIQHPLRASPIPLEPEAPEAFLPKPSKDPRYCNTLGRPCECFHPGWAHSFVGGNGPCSECECKEYI